LLTADIAALRVGDDARMNLRRIAGGEPVWLSSVLLAELCAGVSVLSRKAVEKLERYFERARRIMIPNLSDWASAGKVLALLAAKYDLEQIGKGRLTNDALIAMSAGRLGITVIAANARLWQTSEVLPFSVQTPLKYPAQLEVELAVAGVAIAAADD
jgi:predicted nucleic acid-binding protein